jgi:hypothetical protein
MNKEGLCRKTKSKEDVRVKGIVVAAVPAGVRAQGRAGPASAPRVPRRSLMSRGYPVGKSSVPNAAE